MLRCISLSLLVAAAVGDMGCAATRAYAPGAAVYKADRSAAAATPPPLERSYFARDPSGQLTEEALQRILDAPLDTAFPARVGVLPILPPADWHGPAPDYGAAPSGTHLLVRALSGGERFTLVTEMMPIPSGALGMEALREVAARYRLRYLLLYREVVARRVESNGWAAGYATVLGALFLPGQTLRAHGYVEASLFDVKTGVLLYTVRRELVGGRSSNVWHQASKLDELAAKLVGGAIPDLVADVRGATSRYESAARAEAVAREAAARDAAQRKAAIAPAQAPAPMAGPAS